MSILPTYIDDSAARIVEAAVTARATAASLDDVGHEIAHEQHILLSSKASPAGLPLFEIGEQLVES